MFLKPKWPFTDTQLTKKFVSRLAWRLGAIPLRATFQWYDFFENWWLGKFYLILISQNEVLFLTLILISIIGFWNNCYLKLENVVKTKLNHFSIWNECYIWYHSQKSYRLLSLKFKLDWEPHSKIQSIDFEF